LLAAEAFVAAPWFRRVRMAANRMLEVGVMPGRAQRPVMRAVRALLRVGAGELTALIGDAVVCPENADALLSRSRELSPTSIWSLAQILKSKRPSICTRLRDNV
jgi:hypothetical protein